MLTGEVGFLGTHYESGKNRKGRYSEHNLNRIVDTESRGFMCSQRRRSLGRKKSGQIIYIRSFETMYLMSKKVAESQPVLSRQAFREAKSAEGI